MKKLFCLFSLLLSIGYNSFGQVEINQLINDNLNSRYTNVEIVSIKPDSCPNMRNLFTLSMSLKMVSADCKLNITQAVVDYNKNIITLNKYSELCKIEIDKIAALSKYWSEIYNSKSEKCLLISYRYAGTDGTKTTTGDYYSLDASRYKEGNYPYLRKEFTYDYGLNFYQDVVNKHKQLYLEFIKN